MASILIIDDDRNILTTTSITLKREGHEVVSAATYSEGVRLVESDLFDIVITDLRLDNGNSGIDIVKTCRMTSPETHVIVITAYSSMESAIEAMRQGASDYIVKPCGPDQIILSISRAMERKELLSQVHSLRKEVQAYSEVGILGKSAAIQKVMKTISLVADTDATILITGETGTGKDLVAKEIQRRSGLKDHPFLTINCAAIPESLLESELFGHVKGAFSGATRNKRGLILDADGGTLFLDEIVEMSVPLQSKLLRFLEQGEIRPVGSNRNIYVKVRVIAATNKDLKQIVQEGRFRSDLYYRLKVVNIHLPPLCERGKDVLILADRFLRLVSQKIYAPGLSFSAEAKTLLQQYRWPGNIRELKNVIEQAAILSKGPVITDKDLDISAVSQPTPAASGDRSMALHEVTRKHILEVLEMCNWNQRRASELLQISKVTLWRRMKEFGIDLKSTQDSSHA